MTSLADEIADDGQVTLREAIVQAGLDTAHDDIVFSSGLSGVISLTLGRLDISNSPLTITGNGRSETIIDAGQNSNVFHHYSYFGVKADLTISSLTIRNAETAINVTSDSYGTGSVVNIEDSVITGSEFTGINAALGSYDGSKNIVLNVRNSTVTGNGGRGISMFSGVTATIEDSIISNNGGGIATGGYTEGFDSPRVTISRSHIVGNTVSGNGGGVLFTDGSLTIEDSYITRNNATNGAGVWAGPSRRRRTETGLIVTDTTLSENTATGKGGGLHIGQTGGTLANSTVTGNTAARGGGIYNGNLRSNGQDASFSNSTITLNHATDTGGGVFDLRGTSVLTSDIIAGNTSDADGADLKLAVFLQTELSHSLLGTNSGTNLYCNRIFHSGLRR